MVNGKHYHVNSPWISFEGTGLTWLILWLCQKKSNGRLEVYKQISFIQFWLFCQEIFTRWYAMLVTVCSINCIYNWCAEQTFYSAKLFMWVFLTAPSPNNVQQLLSNICIDDHSNNQRNGSWFYPRGGHGKCTRRYSTVSDVRTEMPHISAEDLVFTFQFPNPRESRNIEMSRLHQSMVAILHIVMEKNTDKLQGRFW